MQSQISWLLRSQLVWIYTVCCLQRQGISGFSRTRVKQSFWEIQIRKGLVGHVSCKKLSCLSTDWLHIVYQGCIHKCKVIANVLSWISVTTDERQQEQVHVSRAKRSRVTFTSDRSPGLDWCKSNMFPRGLSRFILKATPHDLHFVSLLLSKHEKKPQKDAKILDLYDGIISVSSVL